MPRDLSAYLYDIIESCDTMIDVMKAMTLENYQKQRAVRSSLESELIIIGEALRRISGLDSKTLCLFLILGRSLILGICFTHHYGAVNDAAVYDLVYSDLIVLKQEVSEILSDLFDAN